MKRTLLLFLTLLLTLGGRAQTYGYLTFEQLDGTQASIPASGLTITFAGSVLTAAAGSESLSYDVNDLRSMKFSVLPTGIGKLQMQQGLDAIPVGERVNVYTPDGRHVATFRKSSAPLPSQLSLPKGIYVVKTEKLTRKLYVR